MFPETQNLIEIRRILATAGFIYDVDKHRYFHTDDAVKLRQYLRTNALAMPRDFRKIQPI